MSPAPPAPQSSRAGAAPILTLLLCFSLYSLPAAAAEHRLWSLVTYQDYQIQLDAIDLPGQAQRHAAVTVPGGLLAGLQPGDELRVALAYGLELDYGVTTFRDFLNGDSALRALLAEPGRPYMLTLTASGTTLVATVFTPAGKFYLNATHVAADAQYVGWLYHYPSHPTILPADEGGYTGARYDFVDHRPR